jgi:hypothetical protein
LLVVVRSSGLRREGWARMKHALAPAGQRMKHALAPAGQRMKHALAPAGQPAVSLVSEQQIQFSLHADLVYRCGMR